MTIISTIIQFLAYPRSCGCRKCFVAMSTPNIRHTWFLLNVSFLCVTLCKLYFWKKTQHDTTLRFNTLKWMFVTQMRTNNSTLYIDTIHVTKNKGLSRQTILQLKGKPIKNENRYEICLFLAYIIFSQCLVLIDNSSMINVWK